MNTLSPQWKEYGLGCPHFLQEQTCVKQMLRHLFPDWIYFFSLYLPGQCCFSEHLCRWLFRVLACLWVDQWDRLFLLPRFCAGSLFWMASLYCQLDWVQNQRVNIPLAVTVRLFSERFCWEWKTHSECGQHLSLGWVTDWVQARKWAEHWCPPCFLTQNTMQPATSSCCHHAFPDIMHCSLKMSVKINLLPLTSFCHLLCHRHEKST